nr:diguanylate cyclase [Gammaproteobacteria bacterium]
APYTTAALLANSLGVVMVLVVLPTGYIVLFRGYRPARFFVIAWSTFLVGIFSNGLMLAGIVPHNVYTVNAMPVGSLIEVILLSLALADRIRRLQQEKDLAQADFNHELQRINQSLELQVEGRTQELSKVKERAEEINQVLAAKNRELAEMASHDMLTDLLNRRAFRQQAKQMLADGLRYDYPLSLLMVDLDFFKEINDKYGHQAGDHVLVNMGKLLRQYSRTSDLVARYGGEEFILLLSHADLDDAMLKADQLREAVANCRFVSFTDLKLSASFGVSSTDSGITDLEEMISQADTALYEAKRCGRNRVCQA